MKDAQQVAGHPHRTTPTNGTPRHFALRPGLAIVLSVAAIIVALLIALAAFQVAYGEKIYPGVNSFGVDLGGMNRAEAQAALTRQFNQYTQRTFELRYADRRWETTMADLGLTFDAAKTIEAAYQVGRVGNPFERLQDQSKSLIGPPVTVQPVVTVDEGRKNATLGRLASQIDQPVKDASLVVDRSLMRVRVSDAQAGLKLDSDKTFQMLQQVVVTRSAGIIDLPVQRLEPAVLPADLETARSQADKMISSPMEFKYEEKSWTIATKQLAEWITFNKGAGGVQVAQYAELPLREYLGELAKQIDREPKNARFQLTGSKLGLLQPGVDGLTLDVTAAVKSINDQSKTDNRVVSLPVAPASPAIKSSDVNTLTFPDRIETASTSYAGSVAERAHNVELASSRLNGVVVAPNQVFSFNEELGPVTLQSGYKVGWGITVSGTDIVTVPSEGGGICQVATTLFHPVFWAGYPVLERLGHLYWIPRYGQPPKGMQGLDATVDAQFDKNGKIISQVDFKFQNNTLDPVLIKTSADGSEVTFSLYGKKPDWKVEAEGPRIENIVKASDAVERREDPSMPPGAELMIESARDGFKSTIIRRIVKDGKTVREDTFVSTYRPSRNVILVGAQPSPTPGPKGTPGATTVPTGTVTVLPKPTATVKPTP